MANQPNVILICVDQMRADCLSIAGHPALETPHLDYLAHRGVRFTQAYTAVASCIAARAGLLTGLAPCHHGRVGYQDGVTWNYPVTMAGEFAKGGYQTVVVGKMHVHPQRNPMGFERTILHDGMLHHYGTDRQSDYETWLRTTVGPDRGLFDHGLAANEWSARPWHLDEWMHPTYWATSRAVEFVRDRDQERPFFMMLSYVAPHPPYVPPQCYWDMYAEREMPPAAMGDWLARFPRDPEAGRWLPDPQFGRIDERSRRRAQIGYYGLITQIDHQISRLLEHLADHRLLKDTIIMFVSDHGEMLGDHCFYRKSMPYAGSARVPMILYLPGEKPGLARAGAGATVDAPTELRDVMPTLLDAAGLKIPEGIDGQSLLPLYRGQETTWRKHMHGEHAQGGLSNHYISDGRFLYVWFSQLGIEQLFDTRIDPQELHDLSGESTQRPVLERMRDTLIHELTGREEGYVDGGKLVVGRPAQAYLRSVIDRK